MDLYIMKCAYKSTYDEFLSFIGWFFLKDMNDVGTIWEKKGDKQENEDNRM
jgi:hypothetical protein